MTGSRCRTILFLLNSSSLGGANRSLSVLLSGLDRNQYRPIVVTPRPGPFMDRLAALSIPCTILPLPLLGRLQASLPGKMKAALRNGFNFIRLIRLILKERVDLIHTNTVFPLAGGMAATLLEIPHVWHLREGIDTPEYDLRFGKTLSRLILAGLASRMICISDYVRRTSVPEDARDRAVVIPNALETIPADAAPLDPESPVIGTIGLMGAKKRTALFVEAATLIAQALPTATFRLAGRPTAGEEDVVETCRASVAAAGLENRFSWPGFVSDEDKLYADLQLLIHPGVHEAFGRVLIEAMSRGIPVIGVRSGAIPEVVQDGVTGFIVPPDDAQALADAALTLLGDRAKFRAMSATCRRIAVEQFGPSAHVDRVNEVFQKLLT
jgi:glycosyltransferase involved in cell wall biosynthesis